MIKEWSLKITKASNGYILQPMGDDHEDEGMSVYEEENINKYGELEAMFRALYSVIEYFGVYGSKHDARRLRVVIVDQNGNEIDDQ